MNSFKMFQQLLQLSVLALLASCSTSSQTEVPHRVKLNIDLLLAWDDAAKDTSTAQREVVHIFKKNGKKLIYLQAGHGTNKKSKTFSAIDWVYKNHSPKAAVIEGFSHKLGLSPTNVSEQMLKGIKDDFYPDGEVSYMVISANENKIPFIGGEPTLQESLLHLKNAGFKKEDFLGFLFVRVIPQKIRSGELTNKTVSKVYSEYTQSQAKVLNIKKIPTFSQFRNWYKKAQNKDFQFDKLVGGEAAPLKEGTFLTHKISMIEMQTREISIMSTLEKMLNEHDTVFIAYGSSHYRLEHLILKDYFGLPQTVESF